MGDIVMETDLEGEGKRCLSTFPERNMRMRACDRNPPGTASPCQPPFAREPVEKTGSSSEKSPPCQRGEGHEVAGGDYEAEAQSIAVWAGQRAA